MKRSVTISAVLASLAVLAVTVYGQKDSPAPGMEPFTPTKLQWLCLEAEAANTYQYVDRDGFLISFAPKAPDTIKVIVLYRPKIANREIMNGAIQTARALLETSVEGKGWDWLKLSEDIRQWEPHK